MTDKKDGPGQKDGPAKAGDRGTPDTGTAKRPYSTLDLKAVEVPARREAVDRAPSKSAEAPGPQAPPAATPRPQSEAARKVAAASASAAAPAGKSEALKDGAAAASAGAKTEAAASARNGSTSTAGVTPALSGTPPVSHTGRGGFVSHTAAGLLGAAIALVGAPFLTPSVTPLLEEMGLALPPPPVSPDVAVRLAALEHKAAQPAPVPDPANDPARAIAAAEANHQRLEALEQSITAIGEAQSQTAQTTSEMAARLAKAPPIADVGERLVALERQLGELGRAANAEPDQAGRIPQLVQLTGRLADLETALATRTGELRTEMGREIDTRVGAVGEVSETARAATQRLERELSATRTETNRLATELDQVKTSTERLHLALKAAQDETANLSASLDAARRDLDARLQVAAKPADVTAAVAPIASQLAALEGNLANVLRSEGERNATAERIVLALELGNLKRAMERGAPYGRELDEVAKVARNRLDLKPLERYRNEGVPTLAELGRTFRPVANAILDAEAEAGDGSVVDRLLSGARTFVRVRKTTHSTSDATPEAVVARMEDALNSGHLGNVLREAKALELRPAIASEWLAKVEARQTVDVALKSIDEALKASLGAGPASAPAERKGRP